MENNKTLAITVSGVKKEYRLGNINVKTLSREIGSFFARLRKKEDPNLEIGKEDKRGDKVLALDGINLNVYKGERLGIIGKNGAGKTTLLKLISRITVPTDGKITIYGKVSSMLEVGTGFHSELTGRENIYLNGAILGMSTAEVNEKMQSIIDYSECGKYIDTPVKRYSLGMVVKLAFAVAVHLDSDIIIMDEILAVGDISFQKKCLSKMDELSRNEDKTILYVSHNMETIRNLCQRCVVIDKGKIIFDGDTEQAIKIYTEGNI